MSKSIPLSSLYQNKTLTDAVKTNDLELVKYIECYKNQDFYEFEWVRQAIQYGRHELVFYFLDTLKNKPIPPYFRICSLTTLFEAAITPFSNRPSHIDQTPLFHALFNTAKEVTDFYLCLYHNRFSTYPHDGNYYSKKFLPLLGLALAHKKISYFEAMVEHIEWDYSKEELHLYAFCSALTHNDYDLLHYLWDKGYPFRLRDLGSKSPIMDETNDYYGFSDQMKDYVNTYTRNRILRENLTENLPINMDVNKPKI